MDIQFLAFSAFDRLRRILPKFRLTISKETRLAFSARCIKGGFGFDFKQLDLDTLDLSDTDILSVPMSSFKDTTTTKQVAVLLQLEYQIDRDVSQIYICSNFNLSMMEGHGCTCCIFPVDRETFEGVPCPVHILLPTGDNDFKITVY